MKLPDLLIALGAHPPVKFKVDGAEFSVDSIKVTLSVDGFPDASAALKEGYVALDKVSDDYSKVSDSLGSVEAGGKWLTANFTVQHTNTGWSDMWSIQTDGAALLCECGQLARVHETFYDPAGDPVEMCLDCDCTKFRPAPDQPAYPTDEFVKDHIQYKILQKFQMQPAVAKQFLDVLKDDV